MKDQPIGIHVERPDELPGAAHPYDLTGLLGDGGTIFRSKHREARDKRKRSRLQKRLVKAGVIRNYRKAPA